MADAFRKAGHTVRLLAMMSADPRAATDGDIIGIGYPCFSSQAPTPMRNFLADLPYLNQRHVFVFATYDGAPGRVLADLTNDLRKRGAYIIGDFLTLGEVHHPPPTVHGRFPGRPNDDDLQQAARFARRVLDAPHENIGAATIDRQKTSGLGLRFYDLAALVINDSSIRLLLPKPQADITACDGCQRCVMECPQGNITMTRICRSGGAVFAVITA